MRRNQRLSAICCLCGKHEEDDAGATEHARRDIAANGDRLRALGARMLAPPTELFDVPLWIDGATVHPDHHIQVANAL